MFFDEEERPRGIRYRDDGGRMLISFEEIYGTKKHLIELDLWGDTSGFSDDALPYAAAADGPSIAAGCRRRSTFIPPEDPDRDLPFLPPSRMLRFE